MNGKKVIIDFVNSDNFCIIEEYISRPYIETIKELDKENTNLKQALNEIREFIKGQSPDAGVCGYTILQIIDKILGVDEFERNNN